MGDESKKNIVRKLKYHYAELPSESVWDRSWVDQDRELVVA